MIKMGLHLNVGNIAGNILRGHSVKSSVLHGLASAGLSGIARSVVMGALGYMTGATVHITNLDTGERISLAWTPEKVTAGAAGRFQTYNVIEEGEVKIPRGLNLKSVRWEGKLPGESRTDYHFVHSSYWQEPKNIIQILEDWRESRAKLRLLITQTSINLDVYLNNFSYTWTGGHGDADYSIEFIAAKDMIVKTVQEVDAERAVSATEQDSPVLNTRPSSKVAATVISTVGNGNCWDIAQKTLGDGALWQDIYQLNADKAGVSADSVSPGTQVKLPR